LRGLAPTICHLRLQHLANGLGLQPETILWVFPTEDRLLIFRLIVKNISHFSPSYTFSTLLNEEQHPLLNVIANLWVLAAELKVLGMKFGTLGATF
jgi:hypothetical protein